MMEADYTGVHDVLISSPLSVPVRVVPPYFHEHRLRIRNTDAGLTLIEFFLHRFPFHSEHSWREKARLQHIGCVRFGNDATMELREGDEVWHRNPHRTEPAVPDQIRIISETDDILAVYKPAPLPVHSGGRYHKNTLNHMLTGMGYKDLKSMHRLDSVTSGLVLFARTAKMASEIQHHFQNGNVHKVYRAWVHGNKMPDTWHVDASIKRKQGFIFECSNHPNAKKARSDFRVIQRNVHFTLIEAVPITGRTHQLRLHLAHSGHPVVDDSVYGSTGLIGKTTARDRSVQNRPIFLHSYELIIPSMGLHFRCKDPESWTLINDYIA